MRPICELHGCEMYTYRAGVVSSFRCPMCDAETNAVLPGNLDADDVLHELRDLHASGGPGDFERAMELFMGLDLHLQLGKTPPEDWAKAFPCRTTGEDTAHLGPFTTVRSCIDCGCLITGGPTRCRYCADKLPKEVEPTEAPPPGVRRVP